MPTTNRPTRASSRRRRPRAVAAAVFLAAAALAGAGPPEAIETAPGQKLRGRMAGGEGGYRFLPEGGGPAVRLAPGTVVTADAPGELDASSPSPPFHAELGLGLRISGRVAAIDDRAVRLEVEPGGRPVAIDRGGLLALVQRKGEAQVFQEGFEALDESRWATSGLPELTADPHLGGARAIRLPAGAASVTHRLAEPVSVGRLDLAFHDDGRVVEGHQAFVDLQFRGPNGPETVRAVLGWAEESLAVQTPGGPALAVQRLARRPGWHRLTIRFHPERTELSVAGDELARGKGPGGPLTEIRLATSRTGGASPPADLAAAFDDLRLARFAEPVEGLEVDPTQDEARGVEGDQLFGRVVSAGADGPTIEVDGRPVPLTWSEISGLHFRREPTPGRPVEGLLVRLEWVAGPGGDRDSAEGALAALTDDALTLETPYAGTLTVPRDRLTRLEVVGEGRRLLVDPMPHHLGDEVSRESPRLDPPQPEGGVLERSVELESVPGGPAVLVLDVIQVVGEASGLTFATLVRGGELRTKVAINGREFDYLNRHITTKNETPERIRLPIPDGLLKPGPNTIRFEQVGIASDPTYLDDLGVLGIALEFPGAAAAGPGGDGAGSP